MGAKNPLRPVYRDLDWGEAPPPGYTWIQRKFDGHWVSVDMDGVNCMVKSRSGRVLSLVRVSNTGPHRTIIGELIVGTHEASEAGEHYGQIVVFDIYDDNGLEVPYSERLAEAECVALSSGYGRFSGGIMVAPQTLAAAMAEAEAENWEGLIFRSPDAPYFAPIYRMVRRGR